MRTKILVPVVLFGCLYAGIASAKGPHSAMSRNADLHVNRAAAAPATTMRAETRRTAETVTHRSGTSLDHSNVHRSNRPTHDAGKHKFLPPDVQGEQGMPRVSDSSVPAEDAPELNDTIIVASDAAAV